MIPVTRGAPTEGRGRRIPVTTGVSMIRKYSGDKKSIEARSENGQTWSVKLYDSGRLTEYKGGTLAEVEALARKHGMTLDR